MEHLGLYTLFSGPIQLVIWPTPIDFLSRQHAESDVIHGRQSEQQEVGLGALAERKEKYLPKMNRYLAVFDSVCQGVQFNVLKKMLLKVCF